jgi:lipopolysaccharide transport system ATP-binding protein
MGGTADKIAEGPLVHLRGLGKCYKLYADIRQRVKQVLFGRFRSYHREFWALKDIDLDLNRGEMLGVIGDNGAGKSTLLQLVCGTLQPSAGTIHTSGRIAAMLELGAGFNREFTGRENVYLNAAVLGLTEPEIDRRFPSIADFAEIGRFMDLPVKFYSSGMYARLAFAVCAHVDADILIVDEVLSVGDAIFQQKCLRFLRTFCERGTLLFVSHDSGTVARLCQRALWLEKGRMRALGPAEEVCAEYLHSKSNQQIALAHATGLKPGAAPLAHEVRQRRPNRILVSPFDAESPSHGHGGARVIDCGLYAPGGDRLTEMLGGEEVELRIACRAERDLSSPIVGFILRDYLGQTVLGDNTFFAYRHAPLKAKAGKTFTARFRFQFPLLAAGPYMLAPSINEGTQAEHVQLHWIEDAVLLHAVESPVRLGIVGVPSQDIAIRLLPGASGA